jgi:hypothetical protein
MSEPTVAALIAKRDALRDQIIASQTALRVLIRDLDTMEEAIRVFDPSLCKGRLAPRPAAPAALAGRGEIAHNILIELERAGKPLSTYDIAHAIMVANDLDVSDKRQVFLLGRRVSAALRSMSGRKLVRCVSSKPGEFSVWEHVPQ